MSDRSYCPDAARGERIMLDADESHHLARVRRIGEGETIVVFDGAGFATAARVLAVGKHRVELVAEGAPLPDRAAPIALTVAVAAPKGDRFDWLVEKLTELGAARLVPLITERSVVDPRRAKLDRLRRAVIEASKQCGRNTLMTLDEPRDWTDFLAQPPAGPRFLAEPGGRSISAWERLAIGTTAVLAVGPEGGFSPGEVASAGALGWKPLRLGPTILRVETAALAGASQLLAHVDESNLA